MPEQPRRVAALDGIRGLAILMVLNQHLLGGKGGWEGVDLFFALSGFLVTSILLSERRERRFWRIFYLRRVTRILPPFLIFLAMATLVYPLDWSVLWPYVFFSLTNYGLIHAPNAGYIGGVAILWSLCVEEHFYLLWPVQVRNASRRTLALVLGGVVLAEPLLRAWAATRHLSRSDMYFLTPFRLDAICLGCLLALAVAHPATKQILDKVISPVFFGWTALVVVMPSILSFERFSVTALTFALPVAYCVMRPAGVLVKLLSMRPLTFVGRISYGLYLYHQCIYEVIREEALHVGFRRARSISVASFCAAVLVAWLSYRFVEQPVMAFGRRKTRMLREEETAVRMQVSDGAA